MNRKSPFLSSSFHLPRLNSLVGFTGKLDSVETDSEGGSESAICAAVSVETISHLITEDESSVTKEDDDTVALKTLVHKYSNQTELEQTNAGSSQKETFSGTPKGKRKLTLTLDSSAGNKAERGDKKKK